MTEHSDAKLLAAAGPRAAEGWLLDEIERLLPHSEDALQPPIRVAVPSRSLRRHLLRRLLQRRGRAVAGVVVHTLYGLALDVVDRVDGGAPAAGESAYAVLVRRLADAEPALHQVFSAFDDGYAVVVATVRDLLDAGMEPVHEEPLLDQLAALRYELTAEEIERTCALVRVAARSLEGAEQVGAWRPSTVLSRAAAALRADFDQALPARAVLIHGYADATGITADLIDALLRSGRARMVLDRPRDPEDPDRIDSGASFSRRIEGRLGSHGSPDEISGVPIPSERSVFVAPDRDIEAREVARRAAALFADGAAPESVAVVARDMAPYARHLARHFDRLGVPFSADGTCVAGAGDVRRRAAAVAALLRDRGDAPAERWIEAQPHGGNADDAADLALGLRLLGVIRLADLVDLRQLPSAGLRLPVVDGVIEEGDEAHLRRRRLQAGAAEDARRRAAVCCDLLDAWPESAMPAGHLGHLRRLLDELAGHRPDALSDGLGLAVAVAAAEVPGKWHLRRDEWTQLATDALAGATMLHLGGKGGGVALLAAMEARALTFEHLFLIGCNRELFPRAVQPDPLLPDRLRLRLLPILPDIPIKGRGWDEERYLFVQLMGAAASVTVSWSDTDRGRRLAPSPFVEGFKPAEDEVSATAGWPWQATPGEGPTPAYEHVIRTALHDDRRRWREALAVALEEGSGRAEIDEPGVALQAVADARLRVLDEVDRVSGDDLGPYGGLVGRSAADRMRATTLPVTLLESVARCPWQALVTRLLGVAPAPDPLLAMPVVDGLLVGNTVHAVLQRIAESSGAAVGADVADSEQTEGVSLQWPVGDALRRLVGEEAKSAAEGAGLARFGAAPILERLVLPMVEVARSIDLEVGAVLGAEVRGTVVEPASARTVSFRADRVDRREEGLLLTDYKTGKLPSTGGARARRNALMKRLRGGRLLQGHAYASAVASAIGRYLYLGPHDDAADEMREYLIDATDQEATEASARAMAAVAAAWQEGGFFPRVEEAIRGLNSACTWCEVIDACRRDDSTFRRRLVAWMDDNRPSRGETDDAGGQAAAGLWWLGVDE